jgi:hypothetical protein
MGLLCPLLRLVRAYRFTSVVTPWGYKSRRSPLCTPTSSRIIHHSLLTSFPMPEKKEREKGENEKRKEKGITGIWGVLLLLPSQAMAELDWTPSKVTQCHLQSLMKQGFMNVTELVAYHVLEDLTFPAPAEEYVVTFVTFYEWGFVAPSHQFLRHCCGTMAYSWTI